MSAALSSDLASDGTEIIPLSAALADSRAWQDLATRSVGRSVFVEPAMLAAAAGTIEAADFEALRLFNPAGQLSALGIFRQRSMLPVVGPVIAEFFWSHYGPRAMPLIAAGDSDLPGRFIAAMAARVPVLKFAQAALDDPAFTALRAAADHAGLAVLTCDEHERAILDASAAPETAVGSGLKQRRKHELARQWRKLAAAEPLVHRVARDPASVGQALEDFIRIEAASWKGKGGTSLADRPERLAFARCLIADLGNEGRIRADVLDLGGRAEAVLLTLFAGSTGFLWKITHSERVAFASPGVQLVRLATEAFLAEPAITLVDSLATANHNLMDRLWAGRQRMGTLFIATSPAQNGTAQRAASLHRLKTSALDGVRQIRHRLHL